MDMLKEETQLVGATHETRETNGACGVHRVGICWVCCSRTSLSGRQLFTDISQRPPIASPSASIGRLLINGPAPLLTQQC